MTTLHLDDNTERNCYNCLQAHFFPTVGASLGPQPSPPESGWVECNGMPMALTIPLESLDKEILLNQFTCDYWLSAPPEDMDDIFWNGAWTI